MLAEVLTPKQEQLVLRMGDYRGAESVEGSHPDALMDAFGLSIQDLISSVHQVLQLKNRKK